MTTPTCPCCPCCGHPLRCPSCDGRKGAAKGGSSTSERKREASRRTLALARAVRAAKLAARKGQAT